MRVLFLTTDADGGHGGIALYNRDLADALAELPALREIVVLPRHQPFPALGVPAKVRFLSEVAGGKWRYIKAALGLAGSRFDLLICGHINLLPLAALLRLRLNCPLVLLVYGIDVWQPARRITRFCLRSVSAVWSISALTRERMNAWAKLPETSYRLLPNAIHMDRYGVRPRSAELIARYGLHGRRVIATIARLPGADRYKGVDEVLEVMPALLAAEPNLVYLVVGEGSDRARLQAKALALGLREQVVFTGFVDEAEKADHFRLADAFVLPGRGEGFGFVFLEAMACGVPVVGSKLDGSREALRGGELGELVDPCDQQSITSGILSALRRPIAIPPGLEYFSWPRFCERVETAIEALLPKDGK